MPNIQLYTTPVPARTTDEASDQIGSAIEQAGLLEQGGTSVENVSTESVDFQKEGRIQYGSTLSVKIAKELDSLGESAYTTLPLYDADGNVLGRKRGYYEIQRIDVTPAQSARDDVYQYDVRLTNAGTRESHRRAVETNPGSVATLYPDASAAPVLAIPDAATDVHWYDDASGVEPATSVETVEAEFGTVARYDPSDATASAPTLTYDLAFASDGPTDVRVYDSRDRVKFASTASGGEVNTWAHAYHTGYQFDGAAVIDTGRFRLVLDGDLQTVTETNDARTVADGETFTVADGETVRDESVTVESTGELTVEADGRYYITDTVRGDIAASRWDDAGGAWDPVYIDPESPWSLASWSLSRIRPARVELQAVFTDGTDESRVNAILERGSDGIVWTTPENADPTPQGVIDLLERTARETDETATPTQSLIEESALQD